MFNPPRDGVTHLPCGHRREDKQYGIVWKYDCLCELPATASPTPSSNDPCSQLDAYERAFSIWQSRFEEYDTTNIDLIEDEMVFNQKALLKKLDTLFPDYSASTVEETLTYSINVNNGGVSYSVVTIAFDVRSSSSVGQLLQLFKYREQMYQDLITMLLPEVLNDRPFYIVVPLPTEKASEIIRADKTCSVPMVDNPGYSAVVGQLQEIAPGDFQVKFDVVCGTEQYVRSIVDDDSLSIGSRRLLNIHSSFKKFE
ncbi:hypothetical protein CYMTET_55069 [Cymbomonas tetramitiformis]|uniref:Uncharacterized protein n=1 Tax=Cymbomonas tetramitiformis TaxID=36881 RepID=A0AAE0EN06_9CHLO|nr:hypothetical protein CYMTET_55069 [Cymbomonas tetramitiformis]